MEHWDTIAGLRRSLAATLAELQPEQWHAPTLCEKWTVRHLIGHLVSPLRTGVRGFLPLLVAARGRFDRATVLGAEREARRPTADLVADLRRLADSRFKPPGFGSDTPLTETLVHASDILIPLGIPDRRPTDPWRYSLGFLVTPNARRGFVDGRLPALRYVATDLGWEHGHGPEVRAPAQALALTMLRRRALLGELRGPGAPTLEQWVTSPPA